MKIFSHKILSFVFIVGTIFFVTGCREETAKPDGSGDSNAVVTISAIVRADDSNFDTWTKSGVVLVDFYADWCGPCRMMQPHLEAVAEKLKDKITVVKVDTERSENTARKYGVQFLPTLYVFVDGQPVHKVEGVLDENGLTKMLEPFLEKLEKE